MTILLAVGDCFSAFLLGPVLRELRARSASVRVVHAATAAELAGMRELLGAPDEAHELPVSGFAGRLAAADAAARHAVTAAVTIATCGVSPFAVAVAEAAAAQDRRHVRLDGGVRAFGSPNGASALADAAAREHVVASEDERREILRLGAPAGTVHVAGDLVADALAAFLPPGRAAAPSTPELWLALEHADPLAPGIETALSLAIGACGLPARTATARLFGCATVAPGDAHGQLAAAVQARALVTDSIGHQRLAVAAGVPCVVLPGAALWPQGVAAGLLTQAEIGEHGVLAALRLALGLPRGTRAAANGAGERIAALLTGAPVAAAAIALPSDGDASGRTFTNDEAALVTMVLQRGTLNSTRGTMVTQFERRFAQWLGRKHAIACASGSAAVHCALAALGLQPGDEVITTPITDMGALTPILYEGAVPVFADVDPTTLNVTADTVRAQLTDRTRAIVVTHLFGMPCDLDGILALARDRGLPLIEDAAQAFGACWREHTVGTYGALAAFSLQQGKHITTGEGGIVATDDEVLARRMFLFVNKAWGYGDKQPDHYFPALNYRLTELQGAVALAQLPKLDGVVAARREVAAGLRRELADVAGLHLPGDPPHGTHSWWKFAFRVDAELVPGGASALGRRMQAAGIACVPRYIQKPAFECELFRDWRKSPVTWLPLQHSPRRDRAAAMFSRADYPGACTGLEQVVVLPINERYTKAHVEYVADRIRAAVGALQHA